MGKFFLIAFIFNTTKVTDIIYKHVLPSTVNEKIVMVKSMNLVNENETSPTFSSSKIFLNFSLQGFFGNGTQALTTKLFSYTPLSPTSLVNAALSLSLLYIFNIPQIFVKSLVDQLFSESLYL